MSTVTSSYSAKNNRLCHYFFETQFYLAKKYANQIDFKPEWVKGTGYLHGAVAEVTKKILCFIDNYGRRGLLIPHDSKSSLVIFERDTDAPLRLSIQWCSGFWERCDGQTCMSIQNLPFALYGDDDKFIDPVSKNVLVAL